MHEKEAVVLDSNEIIFGLGGRNYFCRILIDRLYKLKDFYNFRINGQIFSEIIRNMPKNSKEKFTALIKLDIIKYDNLPIDNNFIEKYKNLGLKKGDIVIAAYADKIKADYIISENRHFLKELKAKKFNVLNAERFIRTIISQDENG